MEKTMSSSRETVTTIQLDRDQILVFDNGRDGRLRVLYGSVWLTGEHEAGDSILQPGGEAPLRGGRTLVEGLKASQLQVVQKAGRLTDAGVAWARRLRRRLHTQVVRLQLGVRASELGA
jgi:hypothetical protein